VAPVYIDGEKAVTLKGERIAEEFQALVNDYVAKNYAPGADRSRHRTRKKEIPIKAVA
jgi:(E)-4-hydroxy-3-methylbut-2-enyl-diphosphate synthase